MFVREIIGDMLGENIRSRAVVFTPSGVIHDQFTRSKFPARIVELINSGLMTGIVHLVADTEYRHGRVIAVLQNGIAPVGIIHCKGFFLSAFIEFIGESDFHVNKKTFFISSFHKIQSRYGTVKTYKVEAVFFRLPDIFDGGIFQRTAGHIGVFMSRDTPDVAAHIYAFTIEQNTGIGK